MSCYKTFFWCYLFTSASLFGFCQNSSHEKVGERLIVCYSDTFLIDKVWLLDDDLTFAPNDSLEQRIKSLDLPLFSFPLCYSNKYILDDRHYLIQVIDYSTYTGQLLLCDSISGYISGYTLHWSREAKNRIYVYDFLDILRKKCTKKRYRLLAPRIKEIVKLNQQKFPVFP